MNLSTLRPLFTVAIAIIALSTDLQAQYAPAAGKLGSTAIHGDSSCFVGWAQSTNISAGFRQVNVPDSGRAAVGDANSAIGKYRKNGVFSLGDAGSVVLFFNPPIIDGPGFDFAVFENAFNDSFLELAHVEISENGTDFYRFPSVSLTQTDSQTSSFGATFPENIHNLAGKYRMPFGTPFDISDLKPLNLPSQFYFVKIIDVVGSINLQFGSKDSKGNIINDPWPTNFASSGFDLDAVGVINQGVFNGTTSLGGEKRIWYDYTTQNIWALEDQFNISILSVDGKEIDRIDELHSNESKYLDLAPGVYILKTNHWFHRISIQ